LKQLGEVCSSRSSVNNEKYSWSGVFKKRRCPGGHSGASSEAKDDASNEAML